ncbi:MAG: ROK family protein [Solirubrobacteraceae bacterium]
MASTTRGSARSSGKASTAPVMRGGIDLGGTKVEAIVVNGRNKVLGAARHPTPTEGQPSDVADTIVAALTEACAAAGVAPGSLRGAGVGSPGIVDGETGAVSSARNLPGWDGTFPLGETLSKALGVPVAVGNDVRVATEAEFHLGAGRPYRTVLGVFWGTGVGGGLILQGKVWLGRGSAGEIGHTVIKLGGRRCGCGRRGCVEAYAGRAAMERQARKRLERGEKTALFKLMEERGRTRLTSAVWAHALEGGDKVAKDLIDGAVEALGAGIASAVNLLDVEAVIIGGGLGVRFGDPFAERIAAAMHPHLFHDERPPHVHVAALGDLGGAIGAALLVRRLPAARA